MASVESTGGAGGPGDGDRPGETWEFEERREAGQEKGSLALEATGAISDDGVLDPRDTRTVLGICLSVVRNKPVEGTDGYGVFRL